MAKRRTAAEVLQQIAAEGKGLESAVKPAVAKAPAEDATLVALRKNIGRVVALPLDVLVIEQNVRKILDTASEDFAVLVEDIRQHGVRQNIAAELQEDRQGSYRLMVVFGQRRVLAARQAGIEKIPALIVKQDDPADRIFLGLAENIFRAEMHPLDKADSYQELLDAGWSTQKLSEKFERKKRTMQGFLRLARFPPKAKDVIRQNPEPFTAHLLFNRFLGRAWPEERELVQALRLIAEGRSAKTATPAKSVPPEVKQLAERAKRTVGVSSKASGSAESGKLTLTWKSKEELDKLRKLFS